jgi:short-subunit dehydrogenase
MKRLDGSTIVLTGASSGIGAAAARQLAARGAHVCMIARRADELEAVASAIGADGGSASAYPADLADPDSSADVISGLLRDHPRIDAVVNNAARSIRRPMAEATHRVHDYERTMAINYFGAVRLTLGLLPRFLEQGRGHVVISSSMSTQLPIPLFSAYLASKAALESFIRSLRAEHGGDGISTTVIHFPMARTEMSGGTPIYRALPMIGPEQAGGWIVKAIIDKPTKLSRPHGHLVEIGMAATPGLVTSALRPAFSLMDSVLARRTEEQPPS